MLKNKLVTGRDAISIIKSGDTVAIGGSGAGHAVPDKVLKSLGKRYQESNSPKDIIVIHPCGIGDNAQRGLNHI